MIAAVIQKELLELRRDGRALGLLGVMSLLVLLGLVTGLVTENARQQDLQQALASDLQVFAEQGEKNPHSAAHFSRIAHKPIAPLASFDPGVSSYMGQVIWLEAHSRNPAMFRAAEDAPDLSRLENFSVAGVLSLVVPLLIILLGYGSIAGERERGTLRQLIGTGGSMSSLVLGKFIVISAVAIAASALAVALSIAFALMSSAGDNYSATELLGRGLALLIGYSLYAILLTGLTLLVSMLVTQARAALLVMLGVWVVSVVAVPRLSASVAERMYPSPSADRFWDDTQARLQTGRPDRDSADYETFERFVVERALGRDLAEGELESLDINRDGLRLEVSEVIDQQAYQAAYAELFETYKKQKQVRRALSLFSPTIALQHLSNGFAGTDVSAHEHFSIVAEQQRNTIVQAMNEDMMLNGVGESFAYLAPPEFWETVPEFSYQPPSVAFAWSQSLIDMLVLLLWACAAAGLALWLGRNPLRL